LDTRNIGITKLTIKFFLIVKSPKKLQFKENLALVKTTL